MDLVISYSSMLSLAQMNCSLFVCDEGPVKKTLSRSFELQLLAQCLPRNNVETMVRRFAFG
ncbi:hypothetical protein X772_19860 [Mesorhizobium sp. LSJC280B00]|nr:hypothetical protein X772_19860 [Mesorhizobium sp. LSJC280B00]